MHECNKQCGYGTRYKFFFCFEPVSYISPHSPTTGLVQRPPPPPVIGDVFLVIFIFPCAAGEKFLESNDWPPGPLVIGDLFPVGGGAMQPSVMDVQPLISVYLCIAKYKFPPYLVFCCQFFKQTFSEYIQRIERGVFLKL